MSDERAAGPMRSHLLAEAEEGDARGIITVEPNVLVEVIELTARSIEGVSGFVSSKKAGGRAHSIMHGPEPRAEGTWHEHRGILVGLTDGIVDADLTITVESGVSIPTLAQELQNRLRASTEQLLGFRIGLLAIHVADIVPPSDKAGGA